MAAISSLSLTVEYSYWKYHAAALAMSVVFSVISIVVVVSLRSYLFFPCTFLDVLDYSEYFDTNMSKFFFSRKQHIFFY